MAKQLHSTIKIDNDEYEVVAKTAEKVAHQLVINVEEDESAFQRAEFNGSALTTLTINKVNNARLAEVAKKVEHPLTINVVNGTTETYKYDGSNTEGNATEITIKAVEEAGKLSHGLKVYEGMDTPEPAFTFDGSVEGQAIRLLTPADVTYTNNNPTINALGGVSAGTTFNNVPITEMLTQLLYPYIAPVISNTSRSITNNKSILECGETQVLSSLGIQVVKKSKPITSIQLYRINSDNTTTLVQEKTEGVGNSGTYSFAFDPVITISSTNNPKYKFKITDGQGTDEENVTTSTFVYPYYYGAIGVNTAISETVIKGLTKKVESKSNKAWTFNLTNQKAVFAYPKAYGLLKSIIDANNYSVLNTFTYSELSITGIDGTSQPYYIYVANDASTVSDFKYTFNI